MNFTFQKILLIRNELRRCFSYSKNLNKKITFVSVKLELRVTRRSLRVAIESSIPLATSPSLPSRPFLSYVAHSPDPSCPIYPLQRLWFTSTWRFHPRENTQFASDAHRDHVEILIGPLGFASVRDNRGKKKKEESEPTHRLFAVFVFAESHMRSHACGTGKSDSSGCKSDSGIFMCNLWSIWCYKSERSTLWIRIRWVLYLGEYFRGVKIV